MAQRRSVHIRLVGRRDLNGQIYRQIRQAILDGLLEPTDVLPSTRELAAQLAVSRTTVGAAYDRLMAEGLAAGRAGVGTIVGSGLAVAGCDDSGQRSPLRPAAVWAEGPPVRPASGIAAAYDLRPGTPDPHLFPFATWRNLVARHTTPKVILDRTVSPGGHLRLREALTQHLGLARGVRTGPDGVFATHSARQALELAARVLLTAGDTVAVEEPGDRTVRVLFTSLGVRTVPIPVDDDGAVIAAIPSGVRCVYVRAARQLPLGMALSEGRRQELLAWADRTQGMIIEDDCGGQLQYAPRPASTLHALDEGGRVVHVGSLRCLMVSGLGVGYLVAPQPLHDAIGRARQVSEPYQPTPMQLAVAAFIDEGHLARHIRRVRPIYAERRQLLDAAARRFTPYARFARSTTGLDIALIFTDDGLDDAAIAHQALAHDIEIVAISELATSRRLKGLLLGYGALPAEHLDTALDRLQAAIRGWRWSSRPSHGAIQRHSR